MTCPQDKPDLPEGVGSSEPQPAPPKKRRGCWVVVLMTLAVLAMVAAMATLMMVSALQNARKRARLLVCTSHLKIIGLAARGYAMEHNDQYPLDLRALRDLGYITDPLVYLCPSVSKSPEPAPVFVTSYVYIGAGLQDGSTPGDIPIAMDDPRDHDGDINILFTDGHVQGFGLPKKMTSCVEVLHHLFPDLDRSPEGRLVLENAEKADSAGTAR